MTTFLIFAGSGLIILGAFSALKHERWFSRAIHTRAIVVRVEGDSPGESVAASAAHAKVTPVVRFEASDGRTVEGRADHAISRKVLDTGDEVEIMHAPGDPSDFRIGKGVSRGSYLMALAVGAAFIVISFL